MVEATSQFLRITLDSEHIGAAGIPSVLHQVREASSNGVAGILLDISRVRTIDSGGLGFFASLCRRAGENGFVVLVGTAQAVAEAIQRAGLTDLFAQVPDVQRAEQLLRLHFAVGAAEKGAGFATAGSPTASDEYGTDQRRFERGTADRDRYIPEPTPGG